MEGRRLSSRIHHDPDVAAAVMADPSALHIVRPLQFTNLEKAFRVHMPPLSLDEAGLRLNDVCKISSEDGFTGYGIAWRADDRMGPRPKLRPIKMTELVRSAFNFQEGSRVTIMPTKVKIHRADRIVLSDITPDDFIKGKEQDDGCWKGHLIGLFSRCDALTPGIAFDVSNNHRAQKRFYIEQIESSGIPHDTPGLFKMCDSTEIVLPQDSTSLTLSNSQSDGCATATTVDAARYQLDTERIAGLAEQCSALNLRLKTILDLDARRRCSGVVMDSPILLYGFEGTGKTMLLEELAKAPFRKVLKLNRESLNSGTVTRNKSIIQSVFQEASMNQPSLIIMDDLEQLVPADDATYVQTIANGFEKISYQCRILVVGAARSDLDIHRKLLGPTAFAHALELQVPHLAARTQILNILRGKPANSIDSVSSGMASQTSGFTAKDLAILYEKSKEVALARVCREWEELSTQAQEPPPQWSPPLQSPPQSPSALQQSPPQSPFQHRHVSHHHPSVRDPPGDSDTEHLASAEVMPTACPRHTSAPPRYSLLSNVAEPAQDTNAPSQVVPINEVTLADLRLTLPKIRPAALREFRVDRPNITWRDIGGSKSVAETFEKYIEWPRKYKALCEAFDWEPPRGVLLYGPPGCSKTLTAQAVANTHGLNFVAVKGAELISKYVGESERSIRRLFDKARAATPCVIFFDEIDSIAGDRRSGGTNGLNVLSTLLTEMDGFEKLEDVFILAATNRPETLDPAILRPGRFDHHVYIGLPDEHARREIVQLSMKRVPWVEKGADLIDSLVQKTQGYSGAEIVQICRMAKSQAMTRSMVTSAAEVTAADLDQALRNTTKMISQDMLDGYTEFGKKSHLSM